MRQYFFCQTWTEINCTIRNQAIFFFLMDPELLDVGESGAANPLLDIDV